jgi:hypothetical protein
LTRPPNVTDRHLGLIIDSLPGMVDARRRKLLRPILRDWYCTELREYLSEEPRAIIRQRVKRLEAVGRRADELLRALEAIEKADDRFWIVSEMARANDPYLSQSELDRQNDRFDEVREFLRSIALAAKTSTAIWKKSRGGPRNLTAYLVMLDAAAIFEWATGIKPTRRVDRITGCETGPFFTFAAAVWPVAFGRADDGLPAAMKNWAIGHKKYRDRSPLLYNLNMRHWEWGVFDR